MRNNGKNDIYSHAETSGARRGAFFQFSHPTLRRCLHLFVSNQFWRTAGAFSKTTIFFKLQAGVSLVSSVPPPRPTALARRPHPTPAAPEFDRLKSLYSTSGLAELLGGWPQYEYKSSPETVHSYSCTLRRNRNVPYFYDAVKQHYFASVSALGLCFPLTMMVSGFGPYRHLRPNDAPTECADIIPTPWAMMPALGFVSYCWGHELLVTPPHDIFVQFFFLGENVSCQTMKMHFNMNYHY